MRYCRWSQYVVNPIVEILYYRSQLTVWYYFNDIYPPLHNNHSPLDPPAWWIRLIEGGPPVVDEAEEPEPSHPAAGPRDHPLDDTTPAQ